MCDAAPEIIYLFDRMGVMFNRTPEGLLDFRRFGGTRHHRTAFAGATTGQQLLYALDEQVRRHEVAGQVRKFEGWDQPLRRRRGAGSAVAGKEESRLDSAFSSNSASAHLAKQEA